ncbi:MAG: hypothetical protein H8K08_04235 [Nitrospira sp.]|nr:hypothetical protein [Nitrospira sp.]
MSEPECSKPAPSAIQTGPAVEADESYERGLALRKAGLFRPSIEQFEKAAADPVYALKAYAHMGLSYKSCNQYVEAVEAFRNALSSPGAATKDVVQILYVLGRTLESLGRIAEALEAYRWLRREDSLFRDVGARIDSLSAGRTQSTPRLAQTDMRARHKSPLHAWNSLLRNAK